MPQLWGYKCLPVNIRDVTPVIPKAPYPRDSDNARSLRHCAPAARPAKIGLKSASNGRLVNQCSTLVLLIELIKHSI